METITDLKQEIERLREQIKEGETSRIRAVRTLANDLQAWWPERNSAPFPRAAFIGLVFSFLLPRIVLVLGSVAAMAIALVQLWLVATQNEIMGRQAAIMDQQRVLMAEESRLMAQQGRLLKAQTVATILPSLSTVDALDPSNRAMLSAFGDLTLDVVLPIVLRPNDISDNTDEDAAGDVIWRNAAYIVARNASKLSRDDARDVFEQLIYKYSYFLGEWYAPAMYVRDVPLVKPPLGKEEIDWDKVFRSDGYEVRVQAFAASIREFLDSRPPTSEDFESLPLDRKQYWLDAIADHYLYMRLYEPPLKTKTLDGYPLDIEFTKICKVTRGADFRGYLGDFLDAAIKNMTTKAPDTKMWDVTKAVVMITCGMTASKEEGEWELWRSLYQQAFPSPGRVLR